MAVDTSALSKSLIDILTYCYTRIDAQHRSCNWLGLSFCLSLKAYSVGWPVCHSVGTLSSLFRHNVTIAVVCPAWQAELQLRADIWSPASYFTVNRIRSTAWKQNCLIPPNKLQMRNKLWKMLVIIHFKTSHRLCECFCYLLLTSIYLSISTNSFGSTIFLSETLEAPKKHCIQDILQGPNFCQPALFWFRHFLTTSWNE